MVYVDIGRQDSKNIAKLLWLTQYMLRDMPTEVYCTRANTLPVKEVWMVTDVCGKIKGMKFD